MKATKYEVTVRLECLSVDCIYGLLIEVAGHINNKTLDGNLEHEDGDSLRWYITKTEVDF